MKNQKGFARLFLLLLLLGGLLSLLYLVGKTTNILPKAYNNLYPPLPNNFNIYTLEADYNIDTPDGIRFDKTAQLFYQQYPEKKDKYDFIAIFSAFKPQNNDESFAGLHTNVQNDIRGICQNIQKADPDTWGSERLKGVHLFPYSNTDFKEWLEKPELSGIILLEETAHQWLTLVGKPTVSRPPGLPPDGINESCINNDIPLLLGDGLHWSKGLQMQPGFFGAMREARPWIDNQDGTYSYDPELRYKRRKFHPFDLYLMGLIDKSEAKGEYLLLTDIDNPDSAFPPGPNQTPSPGSIMVTTHAKALKVDIDDIVKIAGEDRKPSYETSQKDFTVAFIILIKPGQKPSKTFVSAITSAANAFPAQWAFATDNRSTMNKGNN